MRSRANVSSAETDTGSPLELEVARVDSPRAVAQERPERSREERPQVGVRRERPARRSSSTPAPRSRASARGPTPGRRRTASGARKRASVPGGTTVIPPGLRRSDAILQTTFDVPTPSEHVRLVVAAHRGLDRRRDRARPREVGRDRAEVEVALVDPGSLDARDDLADRVPHDPRVLAVERVPGAEEDRGRAAPERLGRAHRRVDAELPRRVVRGRHDAAAVRIAADDERLLAKLGILELLDRGEERVEVEVREDLAPRGQG